MDGDGWSDIGYTFAVAPDGTVFEGRPIDIRGSHTAGANTGKIGILIMGDFEPGSDFLGRHWDWDPNGDDPGPTLAQMRSTKALVSPFDRVYRIDRVVGHQDVPGNVTECPGGLCVPFVRELDSVVKE